MVKYSYLTEIDKKIMILRNEMILSGQKKGYNILKHLNIAKN